PLGTRVEVYARTANERSALRDQSWVGPFVVRPEDPRVDFTRPPGPLPDGRFIEVEIRLQTEDRRAAPRVFRIDLAYTCSTSLG
ncbi:MAG: hypothetical protein N2515_05380, partial [Deltaproteobacteria bacterium]|nr:hypothetical protein [Deltaproteobacteria bacterium]